MNDIIKFIFGDTWIALLLITAIFFIIADVHNHQKVYSRWNKLVIILAEIGLILSLLLLYWKMKASGQYSKYLLTISILLFGLALILFVVPQIRLHSFNKKWLEEPDALERWRQLEGSKPVGLTHWEAYDWDWHKVATLIFFGCFSRADIKMEELRNTAEKWSPNSKKYRKYKTRENYYHGMKAMYNNDNASALSYFQAMVEHAGNNVDFENLFSSYVNLGVCYARRGDYHAACDRFRDALVLLDKHEREYGKEDNASRRQNLFVLYSDYALCLYQTEPQRVEQLLEDYRHRLNSESAEESINWFNVYLTVMRQQQINHDKQEAEILDFYKTTLAILKDTKQRCIFVSSMARIACDARLNPEGVLEELHKCFKSFYELPMPDRFIAFSNLDYMFSRMGGQFYDKTYRKERVAAHQYIRVQAADDINKYLHSLPVEAVIPQINCYEYLASVYSANQMVVNDVLHEDFDAVLHGISPMDAVQEALNKQREDAQPGKGRKKKKASTVKSQNKKQKYSYDLKKPLGYLEEAAKKADDEGLVDLAYHIRLNMVDEMTALVNMNEDGWPKYSDEIHDRIKHIEKDYLFNIQDDKMAIAEFAIRLSFFHLLLGEYNECLDDYYKYNEDAVSIERFAPWLREQELCVKWCVMTICFYNAIKEAQNSPDITSLGQNVQDLIKTCLCSTGELTSKWLGRFLHLNDFIMISRGWLEADEKASQTFTGPYHHSWILSTPFKMSVDLTYGQFKDDSYCNRILFQTGYVIANGKRIEVGHPMDMGRSNFLQGIMNNGGLVQMVPSLTQMTFEPKTIDPDSPDEKAFQFILTKVDKRCPTIEDIKQEDIKLAEGTIMQKIAQK